MRVFHSRNVDEARTFLHGKEFRLALARRDAPQLDPRINGVYLPNVYFGYIQYGAPVSVRAHPTRSDYWLQVPLRGNFETKSATTPSFAVPRTPPSRRRPAALRCARMLAAHA